MKKELTDICEYLNNYFWRAKYDVNITISGGTFTSPYLKNGQYFRIIGSDFNDGVHQYPATDLTDETFAGAIWSMAVPQTVIDLSAKLKDWRAKYEAVGSEAMSPFSSESFGNYSYSKGSSSSGSNAMSWQDVFSAQLKPYRRLRNIQ